MSVNTLASCFFLEQNSLENRESDQDSAGGHLGATFLLQFCHSLPSATFFAVVYTGYRRLFSSLRRASGTATVGLNHFPHKITVDFGELLDPQKLFKLSIFA